MKARYSYPLLFLLPSAMAAAAVALLVVAVGSGVLWIFVFGDDPWPSAANTALTSAAACTAIVTFVWLLTLTYRTGKRRESAGGLHRSHALLALGLSVGLPFLALLHQWQVGNLAANSASQI